jgi:hypothetical protein
VLVLLDVVKVFEAEEPVEPAMERVPLGPEPDVVLAERIERTDEKALQ